MRRHLAIPVLLAASGCASDPAGESDPCIDSDGYGCDSDGFGISVLHHFVDLDPAGEVVLATGGTVALFVDDGGATAGALAFNISGGELVDLQGDRYLTVRSNAGEVLVEVDIGSWGDSMRFQSRPLDAVVLKPVEDQFGYGPPPERFALIRGGYLSVVFQLFGGATRLYDDSLRSVGPGIGSEAFGDLAVVNGTVDPVAFTVIGGAFERDVEIPLVDQADSISVVSSPRLADPEQPIALGDDREATVCFTASAGGIAVAGLEWSIAGDAIDPHGACATISEGATTMTVEAGGVTRVLDLEIADP